MRFFALAFGVFAALSISSASTTSSSDNAFIIPGAGDTFSAGTSQTLTWSSLSNGTVTLRLQWGATTVATDGDLIASAINNTGSYTWEIPTDTPVEPDYFIRISDDSDSSIVNYSVRFAITGVNGTATTTTTSASSTSTSSSSTSSSSSSSSSSSTTLATSSSSAVPSSASATTTTSSTTASTTSAASTSGGATSSTTAAPTDLLGGSGVGAVKVPIAMVCIAAIGAFALL